MSVLKLITHAGLGVCLVILASACGGSSHQSPNSKQPQNSQPDSIESLLNDAVEQGVDGIFIYIVQANQPPVIASAGIQDRQTLKPADAHSLFKIASISKLFIAVAATKLVNQNVVQLDDTLAFWLPELADRIMYADQITIRQMLQHRSGIPDFDSQTGFSWHEAQTDIDETLAYALDLPADFLPDSQYTYSNTNYLLIGKILDKALGYSHRVFIQDNILTPLALQDTYSLFSQIGSVEIVSGYWDAVDSTGQDYVIPGGSMISTVKDIATFISDLNTGNLLTLEEKTLYSSIYAYGHSGWLPGYQSIAFYHPDLKATVVQFVNTTGGSSEAIAVSTYDAIIAFLRN